MRQLQSGKDKTPNTKPPHRLIEPGEQGDDIGVFEQRTIVLY